MVAAEQIDTLSEREYLRRQIYTRAMRFADHLGFDFRELLTEARNAEMAGRLMWQLIKRFEPTVLVGPGFGSTPLLYSIALAALQDGITLNILMVRDKRKEHNMKKWVEGRKQPAGSRAIIVDDFMKAGSAIPLVEQALKADKHELDIRAAALFFDMWEPLGSRQISVGRYPIVSLFSRHDIGLSRDCFDAQPPLMTGSYPDFIEERVWWRFDLNKKASYPFKCTPVIADDAVFVADDQCNVWRHNLHDGAVEWQYQSLANPLKGIVQLLQYADNSLVFGCYDGTVTRLDATSGDIVWRLRQDSSVHATPELDLDNNRLFINTEQWNQGAPFGHLHALDWATGKALWKFPHKYWPPGTPSYAKEHRAVLATCNDQTLLCVDSESGILRWKKKTNGLVRGKPCVKNGRVYLATENGRLHCFDIATGEQIWVARYGKGVMHNFIKIIDDCVYVFDGKWHMIMFDQDTGALRWISRLRSPGVWCPVDYGRYQVALSREGHIAVFDPDKEIKVWENNIGGLYRQPPAIANGYLAAASNNQGLKVFKINPFYAQ